MTRIGDSSSGIEKRDERVALSGSFAFNAEFETGSPADRHPPRLLPHLHDTIRIVLRGGEMEMRHFGHRMAEDIVDCPEGQFAPVDMPNGNIKRNGGGSCRKHLEPVAEHEQQIGR